MEIKSRSAFDFSPEIVRESLADDKAIAYIVDNHPEIQSVEMLKNRSQGEKVFLEMKYTMDIPMPGPVKKVLGDLNSFVLELILDTRNNNGTMEITPTRMAGKIKGGGRIYFKQEGDKWIQNVEGDVTAKIFGVGKLVEKFIVENFNKSFGEECRLRNEYIVKTRETS